jgi:type III secretion protein R
MSSESSSLASAQTSWASTQSAGTPRKPRGLGARFRRFLALSVFIGLLGGSTLVTTTCAPSEASAAPTVTRRTLKASDLTLKGSIASRALVMVFAMSALTLLPFAIIMMTSFVKISVVLSIVRSALGTQQIPPTQVITGLALILSVYIMTPVGLTIVRNTRTVILEKKPGIGLDTVESLDVLFEGFTQSRAPMTEWLSRNAHTKDRAMFYAMAKRIRRPEDRDGVGPEDFSVLIPSFVISELKEAFQIGFIIFVPFLVIDMVVSNVLMALGMQMLSPTTISLPFKLLLFVLIDGWYLITKGLITGYIA